LRPLQILAHRCDVAPEFGTTVRPTRALPRDSDSLAEFAWVSMHNSRQHWKPSDSVAQFGRTPDSVACKSRKPFGGTQINMAWSLAGEPSRFDQIMLVSFWRQPRSIPPKYELRFQIVLEYPLK